MESYTEAQREQSNSFVTFDFSIRGADFCPEVIDEFRIKATPEIFRDERMQYLVTEDNHNNEIGEASSNDWLYFRVKYEGYADSYAGGADDASAELVDFTRPISMWLDVELPSETQMTRPTSIDDDIVDLASGGGKTTYTVKLCDTTAFPANKITWSADSDRHTGELMSCFDDHIYGNAKTFLDFHPMYELDSAVGEKEVAWAMRLDERVIPVDTYENEDTNAKITINSEVYWKGNRHSTRRLLQADGSRIDTSRIPASPYASSVTDARIRVRARGLTAAYCEISPLFSETHIELWATYRPGTGPRPYTVVDYANTLTYQVASVLNFKDKSRIVVSEISYCESKGTCSHVLYDGRPNNAQRRLEELRFNGEMENYLVKFTLASDRGSKSGGTHANAFQQQLLNPNSGITSLSVFENSAIYDMTVEECGKVPPTTHREIASDIAAALKEEDSVESSARAITFSFGSLLMATLLAFAC